jgi:hypothetical protein
MISAISNVGELRLMVFNRTFNADLFIGFLARLLKNTVEVVLSARLQPGTESG